VALLCPSHHRVVARVDWCQRGCLWPFALGCECADVPSPCACTTFACLQVRSSLSVLRVGDVSPPIALDLWLMTIRSCSMC
jgi:hypothetical protein